MRQVEKGKDAIFSGLNGYHDRRRYVDAGTPVLLRAGRHIIQQPGASYEIRPFDFRERHAYDKTKLTADKLPKSLLDLAEPSWKGRWAASLSGADFQSIVGALLEMKGEADTAGWLNATKANVIAYRGNSAAMKAVNAGEIEGAVIFHYYYYGDQAETGENSKNVGLLYFKNQDPGAFVSISGGGVLASSKHPKQAQAFLNWITGKGGQDVLKTGTSFEYSVGVGADSNPALVPLKDLQAPKVEPSNLNSKKVTDLMTAAGLL